MLDTSERERPHMALARWLSLVGVRVSWPSAWATVISSGTVWESWPLGPFTATDCPDSVTVTPAGTVIAFFPIRDMSLSPQ